MKGERRSGGSRKEIKKRGARTVLGGGEKKNVARSVLLYNHRHRCQIDDDFSLSSHQRRQYRAAVLRFLISFMDETEIKSGGKEREREKSERNEKRRSFYLLNRAARIALCNFAYPLLFRFK